MNSRDIHQGDNALKAEPACKELVAFLSSLDSDTSSRDSLFSEAAASNGLRSSPETVEVKRIYEEALALIERQAASDNFPEYLLTIQRKLYRELEDLISVSGQHRHHFAVAVPVADRPAMLRKCLESLLEQCRIYPYGGISRGPGGPTFYEKISLFILDDSRNPVNIEKTKELVSWVQSSGIRAHYVGIEEQSRTLKGLPEEAMRKMAGLICCNDSGLSHKGASLTRNIGLLYLKRFFETSDEKILFYFIDSDEEFRIKISRGGCSEDIHFIHYFYWLDALFSAGGIDVLTGKVVGDPPVSPSIMVNTFLDDLIAFFETVSELDGSSPCIFHTERTPERFSAQYHDMNVLFGYSASQAPKTYQCEITGAHSVADCMTQLSKKTRGFFYGLHPTRTQYYLHRDTFFQTEPARTVYTGNYVFNEKGLNHFIPFASLRLRMAGPTLGRIMRNRLRDRFVSANLPLLHVRTLDEGSDNEFRPGVSSYENGLDLSGEYRKQFWGDVMLFSVEELALKGYPEKELSRTEISAAVYDVRNRIKKLYMQNQEQTSVKISRLKSFIDCPARWWNREARSAADNFRFFCASAEKNFGNSSLLVEIFSGQGGENCYSERIVDAIHSFYEENRHWNDLIKKEAK